MSVDWNDMYDRGRDYSVMGDLMLDEVLAAANAHPGSSLDIGCGTGDVVVKLALRGYDATGLDLAQSGIKKAKERADQAGVSQQTHFFVGEMGSALPSEIEKRNYELITCKLVLAFIQDKQSALDWVHEHLGKTGVFILTTPVKRDGRDYSPKLANISVSDKELDGLLTSSFGSVTMFHREYADTNGEVLTYICKL